MVRSEDLMPETLQCVGGPFDGEYIAAGLAERRIYLFEQPSGLALRYVRDGARLIFDWLAIEQPYIDAGLGQLEQHLAEQGKQMEAA
jgi:hypothetical protein